MVVISSNNCYGWITVHLGYTSWQGLVWEAPFELLELHYQQKA